MQKPQQLLKRHLKTSLSLMDFFMLLPLNDQWRDRNCHSYVGSCQFFLMTNKVEKRIYNGYYEKASKFINKYRYHRIKSKLAVTIIGGECIVTYQQTNDREYWYDHHVSNDAVPIPCNKKLNAILTNLVEHSLDSKKNIRSIGVFLPLNKNVVTTHLMNNISYPICKVLSMYQMRMLRLVKQIGYQNAINMITPNIGHDTPCGCHIYSDEINNLREKYEAITIDCQ